MVTVLLFTILLAAAPAVPTPSAPQAVWFTWEDSPQTTLNVRWLGGEGGAVIYTAGDIEYTVMPEPARKMVALGTPIWSATLTGLEPDSDVTVRIPADNRDRMVRTLPADPDRPVRFIQTADVYQDLDLLRQMHTRAAAESPDFVLLCGDIVYEGADPEVAEAWTMFLATWDELMVTPEGRSIPILAVIGNHEVTGGEGSVDAQVPLFFKVFGEAPVNGWRALPLRDDVVLVMLDSGHAIKLDDEADALRAAFPQGIKQRHVLAAMHVPAYPSVRRYGSTRSRRVRSRIVPALEELGVQQVFTGHDHAYKRTQPILGNRADPAGIVFTGDGGYAVADPREPAAPGDDGFFGPARWYLAASRAGNHFILVDLIGDVRRTQAVAADGSVFDDVTVRAGLPVEITEMPRVPLLQRPEIWGAIGAGVIAIVAAVILRRRQSAKRQRDLRPT